MTTTADLRHVRGTLWAMLAFCTLSSVTANVAHAVMNAADGDWVGPVLIALLAPMILLGLMHLLGVWSRDVESRGWVFWSILVTMVGLGATAFRLSFAAVRDLAVHYGLARFDAALVPLMLDGVIVTCTVSLVVVSRRAAPVAAVQDAEAHQDIPVQRPADGAVHELTYPDSLTGLAATPPRPEAAAPRVTVTEHPAEQVPDPAPTTEQTDPQTAVHRPNPHAEQSLTSDDVDTAPIAEQPEQVAPTVSDAAEQADPPAPRFEVHRGGLASDPRSAPTVTREPENTAEHRPLAERLVADGRTAATVEQVTRVLEMTAEGASQRTISAEVRGVSSTAVGRIQTAARELAEASA
ncbi:DUF2637 domain-containing protein [Mycobacteroides chelonae]|uniref:DUF2637 domain-containing protein n=1 Tax=Mycobacteroides chelonae TaxID=1774 RepID=UPI000991A0DB|nr:DUF2637 domain-containing protein [Mycobacteroides chelonae]